MSSNSMGFIGAGRIVRCMLSGFEKRSAWSGRVLASDANPEVAERLRAAFPAIEITDNAGAASADIVFLALHPPAIKEGLSGVAAALRKDAVLISLAPKFKLAALSEALLGHRKVVRMIPNAPSIVNAGFNPISFPAGFPEEDKVALVTLLQSLGDCPEVPEETLEAYAITAAMGPTYLWFQLQTLQQIAESFGLSSGAARKAVSAMTDGMLKAFFDSGLSPAEVMDLVPVKPLGEDEEHIRGLYQTKLKTLYGKLTA